MSLVRKSSLFAALLGLCLTSTAAAQQGVGDLQFFAPVDDSGYDDPKPNEGFWGSFDGLVWNIGSPDSTDVGLEDARRRVVILSFDDDNNVRNNEDDASGRGTTPFNTGARIATNSLDTGAFEDQFHTGQRVEFGYMADNCGWMVSSFKLHAHDQEFTGTNADVEFGADDPLSLLGFIDTSSGVPGGNSPDGFDDDIDGDGVFGRDGIDTTLGGLPDTPFPTDFGDLVQLPINFNEVHVRRATETWGAEAMHVWRTSKVQFGGWLEMGLGARYMFFEEEYNVDALGGVLGESRWDTESENNIVGPQFAIRWFNECCRWTNSADFRFAPALNFQSVRQSGVLGEHIEPGLPNFATFVAPRGFNHSLHETEFAPIVELRLQTAYQLTRAISARVGYNAIYMDGIARASSMVDYNIDDMGILEENNSQDVIMHGLTFGIEVNR
jgi:hypothetical protein